MEKNMKKNIYTYIYITETLCYTPETTLKINYTSMKNFFKKRNRAF